MDDALPEMRRLSAAEAQRHAFIRAGDEIHVSHDYHARKGKDGGAGNALLLDLKIDPARARADRR